MTDELIDPFDDPETLGRMRAAPAPQPQTLGQGGLVDPFDDPGFLDRMNAERLQSRIQPVLQQEFSGQPQRPRAKTLQQYADETYGFEDLESRGNILPIGRRTKDGPIVPAVPGIIKDMAEKVLLPSHVAKGGAYTADDALGFTLDFAVPGSQGRAPAKRSDFVRDAPTSDDLKTQSLKFKSEAGASGVKVSQDSYLDFVADIENTVRVNELDPDLHPKTNAAFRRLMNAVGQEPDLDRLQTFRRLIGQAQRSTSDELADDRRIAGIMQRAIDDYVDNLQPKDLLAGDPTRAGSNLKKFRSLWHRSMKVDEIDDIIQRAGRHSTGFENGIRLGFKRLVDRKGGTRGFSKEEVVLINQLAHGGTKDQKLMKILGKLSFNVSGGGNSLLGYMGSVAGGTAGGQLAGPIGMSIGLAAPPAIGHVARQSAEKMALNNALTLRAMAATGRKTPPGALSLNTMRGLLERGAGPLVNSMNAPIDPYDPDIL